MSQRVVFTNQVGEALDRAVALAAPAGVAVLVDEHTGRLVLPRLDCETTRRTSIITIPAGDDHKDVAQLQHVWRALQQAGATRRWMLVNVGGGMVTDLGGFAAATFKRGIPFVNVPTTVLGAVDAAVGGKTGVNFGGLKNEVGAFAPASTVIVSSCFFPTLPAQELRSGFAEMLKHALLASEEETRRLLAMDFDTLDQEAWLAALEQSVGVKQRIVEQDPHENGLRKALNLGHTVGHAFESTALRRGKPVPHGYAVAWGLVTELVTAHLRCGFGSELLHAVAHFVREHYGVFHITCDHYDDLLALMHHDKKSRHGEINCSLLAACGDVRLDQAVSDDEMKTALDIYRDLMGI